MDTKLKTLQTYSKNAFKKLIGATELKGGSYLNPKTNKTVKVLKDGGVPVAYVSKSYDPSKDGQVCLVIDTTESDATPFYLVSNVLETTALPELDF